ncbi:MAG: hypothetical protein KC910_13400 [Candidatus Eremiobacteraeota bacterium]|nr:hypothetical protein [Candidatus Eremiobacteraeota bacterium]
MKTRLALILLTLLLTNSAWSQEWAVHENRELTPEKKAGWSLETPVDWLPAVGLKPGPPLGEGYRRGDGEAWAVVTWLSAPANQEYPTLLGQGFNQSKTRVAGHDADMFVRPRQGGGTDRVLYISSPLGRCRLVLGSRQDQFVAQLDKIQASFLFLSANDSDSWRSLAGDGYKLSYPPQWKPEEKDGCTALSQAGTELVTLRALSGPEEGHSFRGFARAAGPLVNSAAKNLRRFEPFDLPGGRTAYLAIWEVGSGMTDLTAIVPLKGRALLVTLKSAQQLDAFQRLLRSIELVDG